MCQEDKPQGMVEDLKEWKMYFFGGDASVAVDFKLEPPPKSGFKSYVLNSLSNEEVSRKSHSTHLK